MHRRQKSTIGQNVTGESLTTRVIIVIVVRLTLYFNFLPQEQVFDAKPILHIT
jgi:hypothetical protein